MQEIPGRQPLPLRQTPPALRGGESPWPPIVGLAAAFCLLVVLGAGCSATPEEQSPTPGTPTPEPDGASSLIQVLSPYPGQSVVTPGLDVWVRVDAEVMLDSLELRLDGVAQEVELERLPELLELRAVQLPHTPGERILEVRGTRRDGSIERRTTRYTARPSGAMAAVIGRSEDLISGPAGLSRQGDILMQSGQARFVIQQLGRPLTGVDNFGGNLVDVDRVRRPWEPGRDILEAFASGLNIENTVYATELRVVSDGSDGGAAVVEATGPDDLFESINLSSLATLLTPALITNVPESADDQDLPLQVVNRYILEPGSSTLIWETELQNQSSEPLSIYYGDFLNASSPAELFSPGMGFGTVDIRPTCEWVGFTSIEPADRLAVGYLPEIQAGNSLVSLQGVQYAMLGQNVFNVILSDSPPIHKVPASGELTFRRWVAVAEDLGGLHANWLRQQDRAAGSVSGTITSNGQPVVGARVAAVTRGSTTPAVVSHWRTDAQGHYGGLLAVGDYTLYAGLEGSENPEGSPEAPTIEVQIQAGGAQRFDIDFPAPAYLEVRVTDPLGAPIPAKVSWVGFDPSPDPVVTDPALGRTMNGVLSDPDWDPRPFGIAKVAFVGPGGTTGLQPIEPGEYEIVVSRGIQWSVWSQRVVLEAGQQQTLDAQLAQVVEAPDFVGGDFHVHSIDSWDAPTERGTRVLTMLAEGLDLFANTDHTVRLDYNPLIAQAGGSDLLAAFVGEEITSFDLGHYNLFPATVADSINGGALDWVGAAPPGEGYPSLENYDKSPSELMAAALSDPGEDVLQLNHPNSLLHGYFSLWGVDTAQVPPRVLMPPSLFRQNPDVPAVFGGQFTAIELWRGYADEQALVLEENLGDYVNLLNQGIVKTLTANSDTHSSMSVPAGGPRTMVGIGAARGSDLAAQGEQVARAINEGRTIGTNGPFLELTLETSEGRAGHGPELPLGIGVPDGQATLLLHISSPVWAPFDVVEVYVNAATRALPDDDDAPGLESYQGEDLSGLDVPRYEAVPTLRLSSGSDFLIETVFVDPKLPGAARLEARLRVPLEGLLEDTWVMVSARGTAGVSAPLFPVLPAGLSAEANASLDDLTDGNVGEGGVMAMAFSSPLFLDVNGNGVYDPPGVKLVPGERVETEEVRSRIRHACTLSDGVPRFRRCGHATK